MTRFPLGLGGVREEEIPGEIEWLYSNYSNASSILNMPIGDVGDTRKTLLVCQSVGNSTRPNGAKLDGFDCELLCAIRGGVGSDYVWYTYFLIDSGAGSFLASNTEADLSFTFTSGAPTQLLSVYRLEHIIGLRYAAASASTTNNIGVNLPVKAGDVIEAGVNYVNSAPSGFTWTGATKDKDMGLAGSVASVAILADASLSVSCATAASQKIMIGAAVFDKLPNPTFEVTDNDMQDSVSGNVMTASDLDISSGDDRTLIIAHVTMAQNITFAGVKCNGVSMALAAKQNAGTSTPMSGGLFYIKMSDLPDSNAETADFEITSASGDCNASIVVGVMRGGRGALRAYSASGPIDNHDPFLAPPLAGPHITIFGISIPRRQSVSQSLRYTTAGSYRYAAKLYDEGDGNNSRNYMVSLGAAQLGNGGIVGADSGIDAYQVNNTDTSHAASINTYIVTTGVFI